MIILKSILHKYKKYLIFIGLIFINTIIFSLLNLLGISSNITNYLSIIVFIIIYFIYGFNIGKKSDSKGYIHGLKIGCILSLILFLLSIFNISFSFKTIIYYLILILSSISGATLGINKKDI